LTLKILNAGDWTIGEHDDLSEIIRALPGNDDFRIREFFNDHVFGRAGQNQIDLILVQGFNRGGAGAYRKQLNVEAGALFERGLESTEFLLQGLKTFDVGHSKPDRIGGSHRGQHCQCGDKGCECAKHDVPPV